MMAESSGFLHRIGFGTNSEAERGQGHAMVLALVCSLILLVAVALLIVGLNFERTKLAYDARKLQHKVESARETNTKLGVEKEHLLSPSRLGAKAAAMGLGPAKPGQIRRME